MEFEVIPLPGEVGVEIQGLDLSKPVSDSTKQDLNDTWLEAGVVLFRKIGTSPERHLQLSRCFGDLEIHPIKKIHVEDYPELIWLSNGSTQTQPIYRTPEGNDLVGLLPWHSDMVYTTSPGRGAVLRMLKVPAEGGETGWLDTFAAYEALSDEMKDRIESLEARFEFIINPCEVIYGSLEVTEILSMDLNFPAFAPIAHPLVWVHPISGRKALNVCPFFLRSIVDMDADESDALLTELVNHTVSNPRFYYVHQWQKNDMVLWDNWRTMHRTYGNAPELARLVHRTTISTNHEFGRVLEA